MTPARAWHLVTLSTVSAALILQTALVISGASVLDETQVPPLGTRLFQLMCYFTIQSNLLVAVMAAGLVANPRRDGRWWRVLQTAAVLGITLTGVVYFVLLRPLLDLHGANAVADNLLHLVVPLLAVAGWVLFGPRPRVDARTAVWSLAWPIAWLVVTLIVGAIRDWYPYPFLNVTEHGLGTVLLTCVGITAVFLVLLGALWLVERALPPAPAQQVSQSV